MRADDEENSTYAPAKEVGGSWPKGEEAETVQSRAVLFR